MILRAMPAVALATGRATLAGQVEGDGPDERGYPGWGLGVRLTTSPLKILIVTKPYNKPRNVMNTRRRQGTTDLTFGMLQPGKMMEIADEVLKPVIDLVALQEIRWQGHGEIKKKNFTVIYCGPENRAGQYGTGFIISRKIKESILEWEPVNNGLCRSRIRGKFRTLTIISAYAPTEDKGEEEKIEFYSTLERICSRVPKYEMLIIMGDFNAKVGREECRHKVSGKLCLHEQSNENGSFLVQFVIRNNLYIKSTKFALKTIHMGTWKIPGSTEVNQIDHILVSARHASSVIDVRNSRGANCDSDHYLVKAKVRERISRGWKHRAGCGRRKWNSELITSPGKFREEI